MPSGANSGELARAGGGGYDAGLDSHAHRFPQGWFEVWLAGDPKPLAGLQGVLDRQGVGPAQGAQADPIAPRDADQGFAGTHPVGGKPAVRSARSGLAGGPDGQRRRNGHGGDDQPGAGLQPGRFDPRVGGVDLAGGQVIAGRDAGQSLAPGEPHG